MPSRSRILLFSALSGVLWALAWPAIGGFTWLAFVAWLPLLHAERLHDQRTAGRRRAFTPYALLALFVWNASCAWWFWCVSEPLATKLISVGAPVVIGTLMMLVPWWLERVVHRAYGPRISRLAFVFLWIGGEFLRHDGDLQWPWFTIGNVFGTHPAWVQWYEVTGILGGSLWVLLITFLLDAAIMMWRTATTRKRLGVVITCVCWLGAPLGASYKMFNGRAHFKGEPVEVVVVQPNIDPYNAKFGGTPAMMQLDRMLDLAATRITDRTALVVFPETALQENATVDLSSGSMVFNGLWENDLAHAHSVRRLREFQVQHPNVSLLCGMSSDSLLDPREGLPVTARPLGDGRNWYVSYNAALWMPAQGPIEVYHKSKLVAGVELMPFASLLAPLGDLALDLGGTTGTLGQQEERSVLRDLRSDLAVAPVICYESVFGEHVAKHVRNGATLIAIITNDGWWSDTPGYRQHLAFAPLRAIETRRAIVRSANTGISCWIDQRGVIHDRTAWWTEDAFACTVEQADEITFYVRHGDYIGRISVVVATIIVVIAIVGRIRRKRSA